MDDELELILIKSYKHLSVYEKEWSAILKENQNTNPFIEYEFVYNWWKLLGEEIDIEIHAVKENNRIIAFLPFQQKKTWFGYIVHFLSFDDADYIDIIAKRRDIDRVIMFAMDALIKNKKSIVFYFKGLQESKGTPVKISNYLKARNLKEQYTRNVISYNKIPSTDSSIIVRNSIFSTNTFRAKTYRNFLWLKEVMASKGIERIKT